MGEVLGVLRSPKSSRVAPELRHPFEGLIIGHVMDCVQSKKPALAPPLFPLHSLPWHKGIKAQLSLSPFFSFP